MRDLISEPAWRDADLGLPLPDTPYAVSVALPLWRHVVGYEEGDPEVLERMRAGYPRFFRPRLVREFEESTARELGLGEGERCSIFPNESAAMRSADYLRERADGWEVRVLPAWNADVRVVVYPAEVATIANDFWRYSGEGVSARQVAVFMGGEAADPESGAASRDEIRNRVAADCGQSQSDVFLFPSGMAAVAAVQRAVGKRSPGLRTVQFDFPYVDVLRVQREFGDGVVFLPIGDGAALAELKGLLEKGEALSAVYCEVPSNPLLRCADLAAIGALTRAHGVPLVVDDTVATSMNVDAYGFADLVTTSLTKYFSGVGDVLAGCVTVNGTSPLADQLRPLIAGEADTELAAEDAIALARNSRNLHERIERVNETAEPLVEWLQQQPLVDQVFYPTTQTREQYQAIRKSGGGYGGLFSFTLVNPEKSAPAFYDAFECSKGPSLGTNFSLACPYTLLAHYHELEWCADLGVSPWLIRFSTGLEPFDELKARFGRALDRLA